MKKLGTNYKETTYEIYDQSLQLNWPSQLLTSEFPIAKLNQEYRFLAMLASRSRKENAQRYWR